MTIPSRVWRSAFFGYLALASHDVVWSFFWIAPLSGKPPAAYLNAEWLVWGILLVPLFGLAFRRRILTAGVWRVVLAAVALWAGYEFVDDLNGKLWLYQQPTADARLLRAVWVTELAQLGFAAFWYGLPLLALFLYAFRRPDIWHRSQSSGTPSASDSVDAGQNGEVVQSGS